MNEANRTGGAKRAGQRLREARRASGLSAKDVADRLGLSSSAVRNTENGTNGMPLSKAARYAEVVGVSAAWLAFGRVEGDDAPDDLHQDNSDCSTPGARLRAARQVAGFASAAEAARHFGWSIPGYSHHENGTRGINVENAKQYAEAFGTTWVALLSEDGPDTHRDPGNPDAITITQSETGMWFATRENDRPIFVGAQSLSDLCVILPEAVRRAG